MANDDQREAHLFARFIHYVAVVMLFGAAMFPLYAFPAGNRPSAEFKPLFFAALTILALLTGLGWFFFTAVAMTDNLGD